MPGHLIINISVPKAKHEPQKPRSSEAINLWWLARWTFPLPDSTRLVTNNIFANDNPPYLFIYIFIYDFTFYLVSGEEEIVAK